MILSTGEACAPPPIRRPQRPRVREEETRVARNCTREVQELPPRQQQMRADGGGEVEPEGQEQPSSGAEKRGLADWSDRASADRALSWRAGGEQVGNVLYLAYKGNLNAYMAIFCRRMPIRDIRSY